jgi:hypothetical protein
MSKAYKTFQQTFARSKDLLSLYKRLSKVNFVKEPKRLSHDELSDLLRSAVVLGVSSMDMYFNDVFVENLVPFLKKYGSTEPLVTFLSKAGLGAESALDMVTMRRPYRRIRTIVEKYLDKITTQHKDAINGLFNPYGIRNLCSKAQTRANRRTLLRRVDKLIERRHLIVHKGDLNDHNKPNKISHDEIKKLLDELNLFVKSADFSIADILKLQTMPIRLLPSMIERYDS